MSKYSIVTTNIDSILYHPPVVVYKIAFPIYTPVDHAIYSYNTFDVI